MLMNSKVMLAMIATLSIAMIGGTMVLLPSLKIAEAARSGLWQDWCYISAFPEDRPVCFTNHDECMNAESSDIFKWYACFNHKS